MTLTFSVLYGMKSYGNLQNICNINKRRRRTKLAFHRTPELFLVWESLPFWPLVTSSFLGIFSQLKMNPISNVASEFLKRCVICMQVWRNLVNNKCACLHVSG